MAAILYDQVVALYECTRGGEVRFNAVKAHDIVLDLQHILLEDVDTKELDYSASIFFDKDKGALTFLRSILGSPEFDGSKSECLKLIHAFLQRIGKKCFPYAVEIKTICLLMFTREKAAKVKMAAYANLDHIIELSSGSQISSDLAVRAMIEKLFGELATKDSKLSAGVKRCIYALLGKCAEVYPELMVGGYSEKLVEIYVRALKSEMTSKTRDIKMDIIAGCFEGLKSFQVNFTQSAEEGTKYSYDIFKYARMAINQTNEIHRYLIPKSALELFAKHADQFNQYMIDDYENMYEHLLFWSKHHNRDMLHIGLPALQAFFRQISDTLVTRANDGRKEAATFKFFIQQFRRVMDNPEATSKEVALAIKGYGYFAAPCRIFLTSEDVKFMFSDMIQRSEQIYLSTKQEDLLDGEKLMSLPSFVDALSSIVKEMDVVSDAFVVSLENLVVVLMQHFPKLNQKMHFLCFRAIINVLFALYPQGAVFHSFLSHVVYQGLIRSFSYPVVMATDDQGSEVISLEENVDNEKSRISYKDYIPLWQSLLDNSKMKEFGRACEDLKMRQAMTRMLYDEMMTSLIKILTKLNLSSNKASQLDDLMDVSLSTVDGEIDASATCDPVEGLQASRPKDFQIFLNLVDFCMDLLPKKHCNEFVRWVYTFGHELIVRSTMYPLVSGFYKLLSVCMTMCTKTGYFKDMLRVDVGKDSMDVDGDIKTADLAERQCALMLFIKYTKEILERMKQYKEDLLAGCLAFILSLPQQIIEPHFSLIVPAVQMSFRIGLSYLPLAITGLDAMEYWISHLPQHVLQPHYAQILPCLDAYLKSTDQDTEVDHTIALTSSKKSSGKGRSKIPIKVLRGKQKAKESQAKQDSELLLLRQRMVQLLGALGGSYNSCLVTTSADDIAKTAVAWDRMKHLRFEVPFMDIKPVIYFDPFLPRIIELATTWSDRQTKVAACELLHSLILYMVGRGAQQPHPQHERRSMQALYRKVLPALLLLACDVEQVAKQLFKPLMMQLIHWFSSNRKFESEETVALLDTLMDGVEDSSNTALRDLSAKCIREFLEWSLKQTSKEQMEKNPMNVKSLLKRIFSLALHPSASKRLGAALAFNNIYTIIREEDELVNIFIFEMLVVFVESLALSHKDDKSVGTAEQAGQVLNHIERIIKKKADKLIKHNKLRRIPRNWPESTLDQSVRWLMRQCGRPQTECRHACMSLMYNLSPLLPGFGDTKVCFQSYLKNDGAAYFQQRFESGLYSKGNMIGLTKYPVMTKMSTTFNLKVAQQWFDLLLAPLDCYTWVFGQDLLTPKQVLTGNKTVLVEAIQFFLKKLAIEDIISVTKLFHAGDAVVFTPREIDDYNRAKCTVIIRLFNLLSVCLAKFSQESYKVLPRDVFSEDLWQLIALCILQPVAVGFNMADTEVITKLPQEMGQVLSILVKVLPKSMLSELTNVISSTMKRSSCDLFSMLPLCFAEANVDLLQLQYVVSGYEQLHQVSLLMPCLQHTGSAVECAIMLLNAVFDGVTCDQDGEAAAVRLSPVPLSLAGRMLDLAFITDVSPKQILGKVLDKTPLKSTRVLSTTRHGAMFYTLFQKNINEFLIRKSGEFVPELVFYADQEKHMVASILHSMLTQAARDKTQRKKEGQELVAIVLSHWTKLRSWWGEGANQESMRLALTLLTKVILVDSKVTSNVKHASFGAIFSMYCTMLTDPKTSISFKTKVLELLPFFTSLESDYTDKIRLCLDRVIAENFPLKSSEFVVGSAKYNCYIEALDAILSALELSGSLMILKIVMSIFCRERTHVYEEQIQNALSRFVRR